MSDNIIQFNEQVIKTELKDLVKQSVEETLNSLLDQEAEYSGTLVKTKIDKFLNVSGSRHCSIEQQCREVALCWRDVPDG